jgi:Protein of unknown function (DUF3313)
MHSLMFGLLLSLCGAAGFAYSEELKPNKAEGFDRVQVVPGQNFKTYKTIYLAPTQLTFNKQWLNDNRGTLSDHEREKLAIQYSKLMDESLQKQLSKGGWHISATPSPDILIVIPRLSDFFINAPDMGDSISKSYVRVAGHARVEFEVKQADGKVLAQLSDFSETNERPGGKLAQTNRGLNFWDFRHLMTRWSDRLGQFLT